MYIRYCLSFFFGKTICLNFDKFLKQIDIFVIFIKIVKENDTLCAIILFKKLKVGL